MTGPEEDAGSSGHDRSGPPEIQRAAPAGALLSPEGSWLFVGIIFFLSGAVSLVYQILWMKELGRLFGNTAQAAAATLTAFFLGLAAGGWWGGKLAPRLRNPLRAYGFLELGIAASALFYFTLLALYGVLYPPLYRSIGHVPWAVLTLKFVLGVLVLLPAACLIGATLPVVGQHVVRTRAGLGLRGTALYAVNTLGATLGAYLAGFHLPRLLGYRASYGAAVAANVVLGLLALAAARRLAPHALSGAIPVTEAPPATASPLSWARVRALAFLTGFTTLALEVLWTHMFAQVLHNSVYTFAIILIVFLAALAAGSLLAHALVRRNVSPSRALTALLIGGCFLVAFSPQIFSALTGGLRYVAENQDWGPYQLRVFGLAFGAIFLPTLLLGTVFPYLLRLSEPYARSAGGALGTLVAVNTVGAIAGSLAAGFFLLEILGLWSSIRFLAVIGLIGVILVAERDAIRPALFRWVPLLAVMALVPILGLGNPPLVRTGDRGIDEYVVDVWEGASGVVAVLDGGDGLRIKLNNHYTLGGSAVRENERRQGLLPLLLHPAPHRVFYLGMGTGITASGALDSPATSITICELIPDAITAAREHFAPFTDGLFEDPRVRILPEDGRTFLRSTGERFDAVIADLFIPWEAGTGSLYSREHFQSVKARLEPGGIYAQWLPLYQLSRREFDVIVHTLLEVFPQVTLWRGEFSTTGPTMALVAQNETIPLDPDVLLSRIEATRDPAWLIPLDDEEDGPRTLSPFMLGYCGNARGAEGLFAGAPINTEDRPVIEYQAPVTHRRVGSRKASMLVNESLLALLEDLHTTVPPDADPYLAPLSPKERGYVTAGLLVQKGRVLRDAGRESESVAVAEDLRKLLVSLATMGRSPQPGD